MYYDVVVVGGGVIGCAIARELSRYRIATALIDKESEVGFGTSKANSGIIHGGHHSSPNTLKGKLEWEGNQLWDDLCDELGFGFKRIGELTVALNSDQLPTLDKLQRQGEAKGVPGLERWDRDRIQAEEPHITEEAIAALFAPTTGVINPYEACFGLAENAVANGVALYTDSPVTDLSFDGETWTIQTPDATLHSRFVLNCAGLYADKLAEMAGVRSFSIRPRKGEEYLLDKRLQGFVKRVVFPCPTPVSKGTLVIPTFDGTLMVGPTAEMIDDKEDLTTTAEGGQKVFDFVTRMVPGISPRDCIAEFAGLRAVADGEDFIIGPTAKKGFINVAGIQSPGLTAAPAIATMLADILKDEGLSMEEKEDFVPSVPKPIHFASLSTDEQIALAEKDPSYGRIVCRCEFVSEGEILDAIRRGAKTLDGIKFRTRAGMGRCQGGFCTGRCMELLSRELEIPLTEITKRGGETWVVRSRKEEVASC
ncbi:NAD(P)/FAD-dependent oxidoreductase [Baaleninema simplex]|uniref:NAD(P)/FAD-dependent oxidoreductase n=1 Tax=Baaleninema simplex TaxID=2862350 RepID=UPI000347D6CE|nr:NAD(P)/FAD-dependent oxidoreductase [Baaleninema simplex]